jgi:LemA protein
VIYGAERMEPFQAEAGSEVAPEVNFDDMSAPSAAAPANDNSADNQAATGTDN